MHFGSSCSSPFTAFSPQEKYQLILMFKRQKKASSGWSLFWVAVSELTARAEQIDWSPSALPVQEHATMSIYSKSQISDLFYLYSCYAFSSWHLRSFFFSPPPRLSSTSSEIPRHGFSKSHGAVWPPWRQRVSISLLTQMYIPLKSVSLPGVFMSFPPLCRHYYSHL